MSENIFAPEQSVAAWQGPPWLERALAWIRVHQAPLLVAGVGFQLLVLVVMIGMLSIPLVVGETVLLRAAPVDPRDPFRGDYVTLAYDISSMTVDGAEAAIAASRHPWGRSDATAEFTVYVTLEPEADGRHYRGVKASTARPASGKYIKGKCTSDWHPGGPLEFGIESFYVPEGTGRKYEQAQRDRHLWAEVAIAPWGQAALRDLHIEPTR
jgi:uncharacterized membrane-anchored protein